MRKELLDYLYSIEGNTLHYNRNEKDITTAGGIYRYAHKKAGVFTYIDSVAASIGVTEESKHWDDATVSRVNNAIDVETQEEYIKAFYEDYLKPAHIDLFGPRSSIAMYSFYVNSPKRAWKAVQQAIRDAVTSGVLDMPIGNTSTVDGAFGGKTRNALKLIQDELPDALFTVLIAAAMKTQYIELAVKSPSKYLRYLRGWNNRVNKVIDRVS